MSRMSTSAPGPQELEKIRSEITELLQHKPSSALFLRLAFHDAFTYDSSSSTGGANGSIRNEKELQHSGNEGLSEAIQNLRAIKDKHPSLSHAGRRDSAISPPAGRIPTLLDASGKPSLEEFKKAAKRAGLSHRRLMVLCGAHILSRWWATDSGDLPDLDQFHRDDTAFDNGYFKLLLAGKIPQDSVLLDDPELKMLAVEYARSQALFFQDYAAAHEQLSKLGTRLATEPGSRPAPSGQASFLGSSTWTATEYVVAAAVAVSASALIAGWWLKRRRRASTRLL